jgi:CelD/BcsL family acetyltransferase involved in cellulose biosynthesis
VSALAAPGAHAVAPVSLVPVRGADEWDALASRSGGTFFHSHLFLSTVSEGLGLGLDLQAAVIGGERVGAVPIVLKRLGPVSTINWLPFPYVGPLVPPDALAPTLAALVRHERRVRSVRSQNVLLTYRPETFPGYTSSVDRTFVVPLEGRSDDDLLHGMSSRRRSAIRRADRNGLRVREATEREVTQLLPRLSHRTFEQQGLPAPYSPECYRLTWERLSGNPDVLFQAADVNGEPAVVQISLAGSGTGLAWVVGREQDQAGSDAYASMMWRTMCWARERGCREFDLVGAPTEGIANYKRGLGAQERQYTVLRRQARAHRAAVSLLHRLPGSRVE